MAFLPMAWTGSRWIRQSLAAAILVAAPTALQAASVTVTGNDPRHDITVTIEDATVDYVLDDLHKKYGFDITRPKSDNGGELQTVTMSGSLQSILERLLRNWNHMIVRSPDNESGIAKVMILNSVYGAAPASPTSASGDGADKTRQALTGEGLD